MHQEMTIEKHQKRIIKHLERQIRRQKRALKFYTPFAMGTISLIILIVACHLFALTRIVESDKQAERITTGIEYLLSLDYYDTPRDSNLPYNSLKTYEMEKHKFTFKNLGTFNSERGICMGFSLFEKLNYMNKLSEVEMEVNGNPIELGDSVELGKLFMAEEDVKAVYLSSSSSDVTRIGETTQLKNYDASFIYDINSDKKVLEDFTHYVQDETVANLLNAVNYLMMNGDHEFEKIKVEPYIYPSWQNALNIAASKIKYKKHAKFKPKWIMKKINSDEPVIIGLGGYQYGHALLGYRYEYIDTNNFKVYVSDSNFPLLHNEANEIEESQYNQDIQKNMFVLFTREKKGDRWHYIYNPKLNGSYVYMGKYNSYIPGFDIELR